MEKSEEPSAVAQAAGTVIPSTPQSVRGVKVETKRPREGGRKRGILSSKKGHKCSTYGCNRTFLNMQDLIHHVSIHYKPTQSMQDKKFFCSISGCGEILNSMQELMSHLKVHYKPNRYFKCENCMQHFRTHRSLFKHLHVCSDNTARSVSQSTTSFPASSDSDSATPAGPVSRQTSVIQCIKKDTPLPMADDIPTTSMAAVASTSTLPGGHLASMSKLASKASNSFSTFDPNLFGGRVSGTSQTSAASSYLPYMNPSSYNSPQSSMSQKLKPFLGNQSLPASNAMWKKNQAIGMSQRVTREQRIEIVLMSGERSTRVIAADFNARHPTRPPISHATVSKLLAKFRETGSVLDLPKCGRKKTVTNEETSVAVLASFNKSPQGSTRRMSLESGISRTSFRRILAIHKWHPYKIQLLQHLNEHDPDQRVEFSEWAKQKLEQDPQFT